MIKYEDDGLTLSGVDGAGKKISANWMEGKAYSAMLATMSAQQQAKQENAQAAAAYNSALANAQLNVNDGHAMPAPTKPPMKVVSDLGVTTLVAFDPPLADLVIPPVVVLPDANAIMAARNAAPDKAELTYNLVVAIARKLGLGV